MQNRLSNVRVVFGAPSQVFWMYFETHCFDGSVLVVEISATNSSQVAVREPKFDPNWCVVPLVEKIELDVGIALPIALYKIAHFMPSMSPFVVVHEADLQDRSVAQHVCCL